MSNRPIWFESCLRHWALPIEHRNYVQAQARLHGHMDVCLPGEVVSLLAPTRNGKSYMGKAFRDSENDYEVTSECGLMPAVLVSAKNTDKGSTFGAKTFYQTGMSTLNSIFYKLDSPLKEQFTELANPTEAKLEIAFTRHLKKVQCRYLIIDEAQHIRYARGGDRGAARFLDAMKTLAEDCEAILVLLGTYPLLDVLDLSSHFSGRRFDIFFDRYHHDTAQDIAQFEYCLKLLTQNVEWCGDRNPFLALIFEIYEKSMGIFGFIYAIVRASVGEMISRGDEYVAEQHIRHALDNRQLPPSTIAEIDEGEKKMADRRACNIESVENGSFPNEPGLLKVAANTQKQKPFRCKPGIKTKKDHLK